MKRTVGSRLVAFAGKVAASPAKPRKARLSEQDRLALDLIGAGSDVYDYGLAVRCRALEKRGLVKCVDAMMAPKDGAKRQPYFGCHPTVKGFKASVGVPELPPARRRGKGAR